MLAEQYYLASTQYKTGGHVGGVWGIIVAVAVVIVLLALAVVIGKRGMRYWRH